MALGVALLGGSTVPADEFERAPIRYSETDACDPVVALRNRIEEGSFEFDRTRGEQGYLESVLAELGVNPSSQVLVFSRTSLQVSRISPEQPRALYFSDDYYVGWVPGGDVEIVSFDPLLGAVFYIVRVPRLKSERTRIERDRDCLRCHAGLSRDRIPSLLVRSVIPDERGEPILTAGTHFTDFRSPLRERWGGWYVTGRHGSMRHQGNQTAAPSAPELDLNLGANQTSLPPHVPVDRYLRRSSDIATLMIFEHQVTVHNAILAAHYSARQTLHRNAEMAAVFKYSTNELSETSRRLLADHADRLVQTLLFCGEFPLEDDGIEADPAFAADYANGARRTADGRSLRDLQLLTRLYKHRCSPIIYSQSFAHLPGVFRTMVLERLGVVLDGALETDAERAAYAHLKEGERTRIRAILVDTLRDLPASWSRPTTGTIRAAAPAPTG